MMKIIDAHVHYSPQIGPEKLAEFLTETGTDGAVIQAVSHSRCITLVPGALMMKQLYPGSFYVFGSPDAAGYGLHRESLGEHFAGYPELIRRKLGKDAHAMTITLLLNSEGKKMGKTAGNAVWLDPNKTAPYDFYQYWRNVGDADVMKCIRMLTFLPIEQIDEMDSWEGSQLNKAKEILAYELTSLVHGEEEAKKAQEGARALFAGGSDSANIPTFELGADDPSDIVSILVKTGLCSSNGDARRNIQQGGVSVNDEKVTDFKTEYSADQLAEGILVKRGKKNFVKVVRK